jgi:Family of unknown function (DUF6476)
LASPSSSPAYAPLWLKVLVIVMGLLIVAGFIVIAAEIARRMSSASSGAAPSTAATFTRQIALPSGAQVVSVSPAGDRVAVHVKAVDGRSTLYIVDPRNGALLGTVDFPPGSAR